VKVAISASLQPAIASRVTAVPIKSWKVSPLTCAFASSLRHIALKPCPAHIEPFAVVRIVTVRVTLV